MSATARFSYTTRCTLWRATFSDATGGWVYSAPVVFDGTYSAKSERKVASSGNEFIAMMTIYTEMADGSAFIAKPKEGDYVLPAASANLSPISAGARPVRSVLEYADVFDGVAPDYELVT